MRILILLSLIFSTQTWAKPKKMMLCLGKEEKYIHKQKIGGAFYKLNQDMIGALIQLSPNIKMTPKAYKHICAENIKFPSLQLLKLLIKESGHLFYIDSNKDEISQIAIAKSGVKELREKSIHIFINFLNGVQADSPRPNCIVDSIPELKEVYEQLRYLEEEMGTKKIIHGIKNKDGIFAKLAHIPKIIKKCKQTKKPKKR
jgi:hypothetical protein